MNVLEKLINEHHFIQKFLDRLQEAQIKMEAGGKPSPEFFSKVLECARSFTDKYHHFKEEHLLFSLLAMKKKGELDAQIETLRYTHEQGRNLISQIAQALPGYSQGQEAAGIIILENLAAYISLLKKHMHQEDHVFFLMVAKEVTPAEQQELSAAFQREEAKVGEKFLAKMADTLIEMESLLA
ncbi:MAG: hemerythrin domain-containing protein [Thermodesulfobacteriota bacterium]